MSAESFEKETPQPVEGSALEQAEELGEILPAAIDQQTRWRRLFADERIRAGAAAALRTMINTGISAIDMFPGIGAVPSWIADGLKWVSRFSRKTDFLDLTPAVSKRVAIGSEALEFITLDAFPSHAIESTLQLKREDVPKMIAAIKAMIEILRGEQADYQQNQAQIDGAIATFLDESPQPSEA
ncbi:MAG: hypothetical protein COU11_04475 [Candidatus Harrisonbacteria bacterium CG10_big_fil_rev_8_21_14_0_10_49_15]|uniref:Uncharacterized protein n=1 Tax=Candidatus Harrisonbacteria bacterium CG10_big_fil_rev_8_21_14_0_10_49_15 TaxID=1974587 RepID=A0A2H0ULS7_9BACT|nr:MAG: hypothetical protein COU11_04475 [Candidatus Harrisonbacteria bacterium CG10_big_fil_rev_8_21_14_0_10_49_15]